MIARSLLAAPDIIRVESDGLYSGVESSGLDDFLLEPAGPGTWRKRDVSVVLEHALAQFDIRLTAPQTAVRRLVLRWQFPIASGWRFLGDAWERGYGDLEWRGILPERVMPWYVIAHSVAPSFAGLTEAFGVSTSPAALAYWQVDSGGVTLTLDVRCGDQGVQLGERALQVARVMVQENQPGTSAFAAAQAFCESLCPTPRLPDHCVYGANDWYYSYGHSTHRTILTDGQITADLSSNQENPPYVVIDGGWQAGDSIDGGDRTRGNSRFPDMPGLAAQLKALGVRPGIWVRPMIPAQGTPASHLLPPAKNAVYAKVPMLDPSLEEILEQIATDFQRLTEWGYQLIKHDFTTVDILGRWGFDMGSGVTDGSWSFHDRGRTSAEIIHSLYQTIRQAAGEAVIIGCNTIGHLGAGLFELQRTGDDTSGREWERTRKMGVNTLAFRMPQHEKFFLSDADCVGLTQAIPWHLNAQWLELVARSGTPLFVSADPAALEKEQKDALAAAYAAASRPQPPGVPADWLDAVCPTIWNLGNDERRFDWFS